MERRNTTDATVQTPSVVPSSVRADGSVRKELRIRPGFVSHEQRQRYVPPAQKRQQSQAEPKNVGGVENVLVSVPLEPKVSPQRAPKKYVPPHRRKEQQGCHSTKSKPEVLVSADNSDHGTCSGNDAGRMPDHDAKADRRKHPAAMLEPDDLADALSQIKLK